MNHVPALEPIADILRRAREAKGLSQRALSSKIGVPQSHISKIENASVDLQASSLIEIARALDLELMLVARPLVTTVKGLSKGIASDSNNRVPAYYLEDMNVDDKDEE